MSDFQDVIEAFADGEPVSPDDLRQALSLPEGREHLVDVLALRSLVGGGVGARPMSPAASTSAAVLVPRFVRVAAALVVAAGLTVTGFLVGQRQAVTVEADDVATPAVVSTPASAPEPTQVIRLQSGVDWSERTGGL